MLHLYPPDDVAAAVRRMERRDAMLRRHERRRLSLRLGFVFGVVGFLMALLLVVVHMRPL